MAKINLNKNFQNLISKTDYKENGKVINVKEIILQRIYFYEKHQEQDIEKKYKLYQLAQKINFERELDIEIESNEIELIKEVITSLPIMLLGQVIDILEQRDI